MKQTILHINIHRKPVWRRLSSSGAWVSLFCRHEKHIRMCFWCKAAEVASREDVAGQGGRALLCWQTQIITKSLSCWVLPTQRDRFSFPPLLPPLFFFFPQPHTIVNTMMAALKHRSGFSEQDRTLPPVHFMLNIAPSSTVWLPPPPSFPQTGSQVTQGFSLPFRPNYFDFPLSFSFFLWLQKFPRCVIPLMLESLAATNRGGQFGVQPVEQCTHFQRLCLILAHPRRLSVFQSVRQLSSLHTLLHASAKIHLLLTLATWAWKR